MTTMNSTIITKNRKTNKTETINQANLEVTDWGFHFFTDDEISAFKAAYQYRNNANGVIVEFAQGAQKWMVTVFNESAKSMGIDGAK